MIEFFGKQLLKVTVKPSKIYIENQSFQNLFLLLALHYLYIVVGLCLCNVLERIKCKNKTLKSCFKKWESIFQKYVHSRQFLGYVHKTVKNKKKMPVTPLFYFMI